jgi:hypothetical protein
MRWMITEDLTDEPTAIGIANFPRDGSDSAIEVPYPFRLRDGDGRVLYHGRSDDRESQAAFAPLDWAMSYAGCIAIDYWRDGRWEEL